LKNGARDGPGDVARFITGTGGGWGDPRDRDPAAGARDVQAGFVSPQVAREVYGWRGEG
jgi:N-methylhydantoinase B